VTRLFRLWLPLSAFLSAPALAQDAAVMNTITKVAVKSGVVEITGTQKPSFSTFPMTDPPRLVVDISQAVFSGVPEAIDVASGHIVAIKTASYGSSASAIARVVIGFDREVEPDIQTVGNKLVVRAAPAPGGAAVATAAPVSSPAGRLSDTPAAAAPAQDTSSTASAAAAAASEKQRQDAATAAAQEKQRQDAAAAAALAADKQRQDASALAAAAADKRRQDAATAAAAVAEKQRQDAAAAAAAAAERRRLDEAAATAAAEDQRRHEDAAAAARAEEKRRQEASAAAAAEEQRRQQEAATARTREEKQQAAAQAAAAEETRKKEAALAATAAENQRKQQAEATAAAAEERRRQDGAAAAAAEQRRQTEAAQAAEQRRQQDTKVASLAEARGRQDLLVVAPTARATTAVATTAGPHPATPAEPVTIEGAGSSGGTEANSRRKALTFVGFDEKGPRVYVRTNGPVRYSVSTGTKNTVVVELDNTSIPLHNNSRALDTAFFAGPVLRIQPERGPKNSVRVAITLRDGVAYQAHQDGNEVSVQFRAP
jgi:colicin import membrane protein